ncbi:diaminopimelate decarboxylase family protein [Mycolicibacterium tokaiense]|uniref:Diaminopimelate decarboxylase n=1 Tax=Mycolicibacterium tokaiense TaxID=39695 RepID=A0A378TIG0_9MYCO|nr:diaminopimelate decarboxylase [Mycolicibacterium tokaiense]BBY84897.1 diaminopimelate decarboxylase [Mycolicibacterium tokaiense]STZ60598.1 diaminopimelate decarboxylase [Mycolicibacterium tokaiense]
MTLLDILPSLRHAVKPRIDPTLWPYTTHVDEAARLTVGGLALTDVADEAGTPVTVFDEADFRYRAKRYRKDLPRTKVIYAAKALLTTGIARMAAEEHLGVDVGSAAELMTATAGGVDPARIVYHGPTDDLSAAAGVGRVVIDSVLDIACLARVLTAPQNVLISAADPELVRCVLREPLLHPVGLHCHLGTQLSDAQVYGDAVGRLLRAMADVRKRHGVVLSELNIGGGHAVPYCSGDPVLDVRALSLAIDDALDAACAAERFPRPTIVVEPGRALVARAAVTVHRVAAVTRGRVIVDGTTPFGARCTVTVANRHALGPAEAKSVVGRNGVEIVGDADLPCDIHPGDLIAVAGTGAYHRCSGALVAQPPLVSVCNGRLRTLVRRETVTDLMARDRG